jgi:ferredoxin
MSHRWRLTVDRGLCIGSGMCIGVDREHFLMGPDRRSRPRAEVVDPASELLDIAATCPVEAISIVELDTGRTLAPED